MKQTNTAHVFYRFLLLIYSFLFVVYAVLFAGLIASVKSTGSDASGVVFIAVFAGLIVASPTLWCLVMFLHYRRVVLSDVQKVELVGTSTTFLRRVGFNVTVSVGGEEREVTTLCVFSAGMFGVNLLDQYAGKTVEVGHDEKWDVWIVLCLDDPEKPL